MRVCPRCGVERQLAEFARDGSKVSGRKSFCKACDREKAKRYYEANRERKLARAAERNAARREAEGRRPRRSGRPRHARRGGAG
jgi:hypothetical protein